MIGYILAGIIGVVLGITIICVVSINRRNEDEQRRRDIIEKNNLY